MQWLAPMTALYAAAAAVPLLVLLYFLKLKRREQFISSTLLWKRAVQDLQVNAPFQRLRRNLLLLLQLLTLAAVLVALARPVLLLTGGPGKRYVLLIDRSASMQAADVGTSRLELAKRQAKVLVESLRGKAAFSLQEKSDQAMVIAFDDQAKVMCNFTSDKHQLRAAIDAIEATDGGSSLASAVTIARAFAQSPGEDANDRTAETAAQLELFSDGRIRDTEQIVVAAAELNYHGIGESADNVAVVAMDARRSYEKAEEVNVFATLGNYGLEEVATDVQLSIDGNVQSVRSVRIGPGKAVDASGLAQPGKVSLAFDLLHGGAGVLEIRQTRADLLACDDAAWAILQPPKKLSVLLVTSGNLALRAALRACPLARLDVRTPAEFDAMDPAAMNAEGAYDVIVLDNYAAAKLPRCRYLVFGRPPAGIDVSVQEQLTNQIPVDWRSKHPVLQFVDLSNVFAAKAHKMVLPDDADVICEVNDSPAMAVVRRHGSVFLLVGFDLMETNWPFEPSFVLFCYNATSFLGHELGTGRQSSLRVGQPILVEGMPTDRPARIDGPAATNVELKCDGSGTFRFPGTHRAGVYNVQIPDRPPAVFAVNCLDAEESDIRPLRRIAFSAQKIEAMAGPPRRNNVELWPLLAMLALALASLEWFVYNSKVRL